MNKLLLILMLCVSSIVNASILGGLSDKPYNGSDDDWVQVYYTPNKEVVYLNPNIVGDVNYNGSKLIATPVMVVNTEDNHKNGTIAMNHRLFDCNANTFADLIVEKFDNILKYQIFNTSVINFKKIESERDFIIQKIVCGEELKI